MGMEKAVRHVDAINKWRAAQQAAANAELANSAMVLREYPDTPEMPNPKGLRWMELKVKDVNPPEGYEYDKRTGMYISPWDEASQPWTPKQDRKAAKEELERQLKYEGDTMGHCVGGDCDEVLEGRSRIFSLRDARGEPHVTIEVAPPGHGPSSWIPEGVEDTVIEPDIVQIKGKQNLAPKDEYLPFVQDFVRNSPLGGGWGSVGDLGNAQLRDLSELYGSVPEGVPRFIGPGETKRLYDERPDLRDWFDEAFDAGFWEPDFAEGGLVAQPGYFDDLDAFLRR